MSTAARLTRQLGAAHLSTELSFAARGLGWYDLRPFPGYTGRPHLASAEAGQTLIRYFMAKSLPLVLEVLEGRAQPPRPIMPWLETVTLGGRLRTSAGD